MQGKELYNRLDNEGRKIIFGYLMFMDDATLLNGTIAPEFQVKNIRDNNCLNGVSAGLFYFLYAVLLSKTKLSELFEQFGVTEEIVAKNYGISSKARQLLNNFLNYPKLIDLSYERLLSSNNAGTYFIRGYHSDARFLCVEQFITRMLPDAVIINQEIYRLFKLDAIKNDLVEITLEKAKKNPSLNSMNSLASASISQIPSPLGINLTEEKFLDDPLIGRDKELRTLCALLLDDENSVIIHGNPGVGKTVLVKGIAYRIQKGTIYEELKHKEILEISGSEMIRGATLVGQVEERLLSIIEYCMAHKDTILFVDEIHTLLGLGSGDKSNNGVSNILKPYLGDGRLKIIGATTNKEYEMIKSDGAFSRRFNDQIISDPTREDVLQILRIRLGQMEARKNIVFPYGEEIREDFISLLYDSTRKDAQFASIYHYNPDASLKLLRSSYNFAALDGKEVLDSDSIIEGIEVLPFIKPEVKEEFSQKVLQYKRR